MEERIDELVESKKDLADKIVAGGEAWLTEMGTEELKALFRLDRGGGDL